MVYQRSVISSIMYKLKKLNSAIKLEDEYIQISKQKKG